MKVRNVSYYFMILKADLSIIILISQLYCDCFATGAYCNPGKCNCVQCYNNVENEVTRSKAMISTIGGYIDSIIIFNINLL